MSSGKYSFYSQNMENLRDSIEIIVKHGPDIPISVTPGSLRNIVENYAMAAGQRAGAQGLWRTPVLVTAETDSRFDRLPEMVDGHALPKDLLPTARAVVVFFIPFTKNLAAENHRRDIPSRSWATAYESTNQLIYSLCRRIRKYLQNHDYQTVLTPATHNFNPVSLVSRWSHKHLGYLAGLGRFGVNAQLITSSGCAGRLGSLITDAPLSNSPLVEEEELCLYKKGGKCLKCVARCPVGAVTKAGILRKSCWKRLNSNLFELEELAGSAETTHVCGKCQVVVPCSFKPPGQGRSYRIG